MLPLVARPAFPTLPWGRLLLRCTLGLAALISPAPGHADDNLVLATFDGHPITTADVVFKARQRNLLRPQPVTDAALAGELLDDVITDSLISREARRIDLSGDYEFWAQARRGLTTAATAIYQREVLAPRLIFDSAQIEAYYRGHIGRYMVPHTQRSVRNITIYFPNEKIPKIYAPYGDSIYGGWDPQAVIEALYARLADGEDFGDLAKAHSEQPHTKASGGDLGWVSKQSLQDDEFGRTCLRIPLHQISRPFKSKVGWHIVQVTGIREPGPAPIEGVVVQDIRASLNDSIGTQLANRMLDSLESAGTFVIFDGTLERPDSTWRPNTPLAVANGRDTILAAEYLEVIARLRARRKPIPSTLDEKRNLLNGMFPGLCMYNAMRGMGYLDWPEVRQRKDEIIAGRAESIIRMQLADAAYIPDTAAVSRYYREHPAEFARPQSYMIRSLRFRSREQAQAVASAWQAGTTPDSVESRWVEKGGVPAPVWRTLAAMTEGSVSGPIAADTVHWVFSLVQKSAPRTLAEAAPVIRNKLQEAHNRGLRDSWIKKTGERYGVWRYPERLRRVTLPSSQEPEALAQPGNSDERIPAGI
jgi:hypothetical protein